MIAVLVLGAIIWTFWYFPTHGQVRVAIGFAIAPMVVPVACALLFRDVRALGATAVIAYPVALVTGIPLYFILEYLGWLQFRRFLLASILAAAATGLAIASHATGPPSPTAIAMCSGFGALVGATFWLIAFAGNATNLSRTRL